MRRRMAVIAGLAGLGAAACSTLPRLAAQDAGCYALSTDAPIPPFMGQPAPVLPAFIQLDARELGLVLAPSQWALGSGPGNRSVQMTQFRPSYGVAGERMTDTRAVGVLPPDSLVLAVSDQPGSAAFLLAREGTGWRGRVVRDGPPVHLQLTRIACPAEPMTIGPVRR